MPIGRKSMVDFSLGFGYNAPKKAEGVHAMRELWLEQCQKQGIFPGLLKKFIVNIDLEHIAFRQPLIPLAPRAVALHQLDPDILSCS